MASWHTLSRELHIMIFNELWYMARPRYAPAGCASVCRAWQHYFESLTFESLTLSQSDLSYFADTMRGKKRYRLDYLGLLRLRIHLDDYDCGVCQAAEDEKEMKENCLAFTAAVWDLLKILSTWRDPNKNTGARRDGINLELSVHSPSDYKHVFRPFSLQDDYPYTDAFRRNRGDFVPLRNRLAEEAKIHDPLYGWTNGSHEVPNPSGNLSGNPSGRDRLFGTRPLDFDFSRISPKSKSRSKSKSTKPINRRLPRAPIVRGFDVLRSGFRGFSAKVLFKLLHESFLSIDKVRIEKRLEVYPKEQLAYEEEFYQLLRSQGLPKTLRHLHLFRDYDKAPRHSKTWPRDDLLLGSQLSRASLYLKHLSVACQADATTFFYDFHPLRWNVEDSESVPRWVNLRTLSLTSLMLKEGTLQSDLARLLRAACNAAGFMPELQTLEIWNCGAGSAAFFKYEASKGSEKRPLIVWASTWSTSPYVSASGKALKCWREFAQSQDPQGREAEISIYPLNLAAYWLESHLGLLARYKLHIGVLDINSQHQVAWDCLERYR
ncbi:hypothetical protein AK830_g9651 [Neonectria ditissima]|uniref:DUF6546 domain-containing protein n=1 Tax=Neonectria ditissima TaxID=78410 RepID=A0A0P7B8W4_9HYPO|nr:hypothetical protein AK830_g9651 [Neonectria ditissima]